MNVKIKPDDKDCVIGTDHEITCIVEETQPLDKVSFKWYREWDGKKEIVKTMKSQEVTDGKN